MAYDEALGGYWDTVPESITLHCVMCPKSEKLMPGDRCFVEDDSSSIYCEKHATWRKWPRPKERPKPEPMWMAYE